MGRTKIEGMCLFPVHLPTAKEDLCKKSDMWLAKKAVSPLPLQAI